MTLILHKYHSSFPRSSSWEAVLWGFFYKYRWYRRLRGGLWQRFEIGSETRPFSIWLRVLKPLQYASVETEDYRGKFVTGSGVFTALSGFHTTLPGTHPGCNYLADTYCNKCGWVKK